MSDDTFRVTFIIQSERISDVSVLGHTPLGIPLPVPGDKVDLQPDKEHAGTFTVVSRRFIYGRSPYRPLEVQITVE